MLKSTREIVFDSFRIYGSTYELTKYFGSNNTTDSMTRFILVSTWDEDTKYLNIQLYPYIHTCHINLAIPVSIINYDPIKVDTFKDVYKKIEGIVDASVILGFENNRTMLHFNFLNILFDCIHAETEYNYSDVVLTVTTCNRKTHRYTTHTDLSEDIITIKDDITNEVYNYKVSFNNLCNNDVRSSYHGNINPLLFPEKCI